MIVVHGLGAAINRAVLLSMELQRRSVRPPHSSPAAALHANPPRAPGEAHRGVGASCGRDGGTAAALSAAAGQHEHRAACGRSPHGGGHGRAEEQVRRPRRRHARTPSRPAPRSRNCSAIHITLEAQGP